jgi:GNAT superfamily N-acetyltransferase
LHADAKPEIEGVEVDLRDGSRVLVREVRPGDRPLFVTGFARMSDESRYRRFMTHKKILREDELDFLTRLDHRDHEAIGAIDPETECGVGVARMVRSPDDREEAEAAVAVVDDWQGRGLGSLLLDRLTERARELGVERFVASLFTDNRQMLTLFEHLGCVRRHGMGHDTLEIEVDLPVAEDDKSLSEALRSAAAGAVDALPPSA